MEYKTLTQLRNEWPESSSSSLQKVREAIEAGIRLGAAEERRAIHRYIRIAVRPGDLLCGISRWIENRNARTKAKPGGLGKAVKKAKKSTSP